MLGAHNFGGTTPRAARRQINIPTLQSYRLWSLLSARQFLYLKRNLKFLSMKFTTVMSYLNIFITLFFLVCFCREKYL